MSTSAATAGGGSADSPTTAAPASAVRARTAIGTALGIVFPTAVALRDGRVWLTSQHDVLPAHVVRALEAQLTRRAADHAQDDRLLAEVVGVLGAEIAQARGGWSRCFIPATQNQSAGGLLVAFYGNERILDRDAYQIGYLP